MYQLSSPCLAHLSHSISDQISMYLHHHHRHCYHYHYHYHGYKYQIQRAIQDEGLENFSVRSTVELTFVFFAMFVFSYIVMFYANRLISAWNDHHSQLWKTTGLSSSAIASLPVFTHGVNGERDLGVTIDCVVCFSTVEEGERVKVLPNCRHSFHVACIDIWLRLHSTCPLCRGSVLAKRTEN